MKVKVEEAKVVPGRAAKALRAGPHSKQQNSDGSLHSSSNTHGPTSGSNATATLHPGESYRKGEHAVAKELEAGRYDPREPKPKGANVSYGSKTTRLEPSRYNQASDPTAGGTFRPGKDSANCDDSLGDAGRHHGEHQQAEVQSGRGPKAARAQLGRNWMNGTPDQDGKTTNKFTKVRR